MYSTTLLFFAVCILASPVISVAIFPYINPSNSTFRRSPYPSGSFWLNNIHEYGTNTISKRSPTRPVERRVPTPIKPLNTRPTPAPTGGSSPNTTIHIKNEANFGLLLPARDREHISDSEHDGVAYCTPGAGCARTFPKGFITGAKVVKAADGSYIQITGCLNPALFHFAPNDDGGQFDVRFPNGAQCSFGGYAASFIEQIEPKASRFCVRCCAHANDQVNCNSHRDRDGCLGMVGDTGIWRFGAVNCG